MSVANQNFSNELPDENKREVAKLIEQSPERKKARKIEKIKNQKANFNSEANISPIISLNESDSSDSEKGEHFVLSRVENCLNDELTNFENRFNYPVNPAFLKKSKA